MSWLVIVALALLWVLVIAWTEHRSYGKGYAAGYTEGEGDAINNAAWAAVKAENERMEAYAAGKREGLASAEWWNHYNVPTGTPVAPGIDKADGLDTTVFWPHHPPSWPHKPSWRCDCKECIKAYTFGRDS